MDNSEFKYILNSDCNIIQGTHAKLDYQTIDFEWDMAKEKGTAWYRSKERVPITFPFVGDGYLSNKKWPLIEGSISKAQSIVFMTAEIL